jgi:membrane protein YdbS with pleckstrin-like domain
VGGCFMVEAKVKPKKKWLLFLSLTALVLITNFSVYHLDDFPKGMAIGSIIDFMIIIPLMAYFFIIRRNHSAKAISLVIAAGYGTAWLIIPNEHLAMVPFFNYFLIAAEGAFLLLELYLAFYIIKAVPKVWKYTINRKLDGEDLFPDRLETAVQQYMTAPLFLRIYLTEVNLFYYSLFSWKKKTRITPDSFTIHQKGSSIALYIMLIHALVIESIGLHYFLHMWSPIISWILLFLNLYTVMFFLAQIQGIRLNPIRISEEELVIRIGMTSRINIPLTNIASISHYQGPEKLTRTQEKVTFLAIAPDLIPEKAQLEIKLHEPQTAHFLYGFTKTVSQVLIKLDEPASFQASLLKRLEEET